MKRISLIFLLMAMGLAVFCGEAVAQDFDVGTVADLEYAIGIINDTSNTDTTFKITLTDDISISGSGILISGFGISRPGVTVTLLGKDHRTLKLGKGSIQVAGSEGQPTVLNLGSPDSSGTLTISGEHLENNEISYKRNDTPGALYIQKYGVCNMYDGVTIENVINSNYFGGGVSVNGGTFTMEGGTISNCGVLGGSVCYGGGVAVYANGVFNMNGGRIEDCYAIHEVSDTFNPKWNKAPCGTGGGVYVGWLSTFNMDEGTISGCTASMLGGGVVVQASCYGYDNYFHTVGYLDSRFVMNGGTIESCTAQIHGGGIAVHGYPDDLSYIANYPPYFSVPVSNPGVYINGGKITGNQALEGGGGFFVYQVRDYIPVHIKNAEIVQNTADIGSGIYVYKYWTKLLVDNCKITGNAATSRGGGLAAYINRDGQGCTTVRNSVLCNNTAGKEAADVYAYDSFAVLQSADGMGNYNGEPDAMKGKRIDGWYDDNEDARYKEGTRSKFDEYNNIQRDYSYCLIAAAEPRPVTVTFDPNGHGKAPAPQMQLTGEKANKSDDLTAPGYIFIGWYTDKACTKPYDFDTPLTGDLTLYAGWRQLKYTLHYGDGRSHDGEWGHNYKEPDDEGYYDPEAPKALPTEVRHFSEKEASSGAFDGVEGEGYYFLAWSRTDSAGVRHIEVMTPASDCGNIEYYAHWMKVKIDVQVEITTQVTMESGQSLVEVDDSQREALSKNIDLGKDIRGDNCEIEIIMTVTDKQLPPNELASANAALAKALGVILSNHRLDYDISVLKRITVNGKEVEREQLKELAEPIEITFAIPIEWQTGGRVHVFRTHTTPDGKTTTVELDVLHTSAQSCTVRTDEFSVYTLVFVPDQSATDALPKTGDSSSIPLLLGVALLAVAGIALLRKKR